MKKFLVLTLLFSFVLVGRGQEDANNYKHSIGLHAGFASGYGFSYRFWPNRIGFQVTAIPLFSNNQIETSSGLSLLVNINDFSKVRLYSYLGNHFRYQRFSNGDPNFTFSEENYWYTTAIGLGIRVNFLEVLDFNFQAGYGVGFSRNIYFGYQNDNYHTTLDVGAGLYFHF